VREIDHTFIDANVKQILFFSTPPTTPSSTQNSFFFSADGEKQ